MKDRLKAVGCTIYAGGFTVGVKRHFDVLCHLEGDKYGVATARANFPTMPIHVGKENWPLEQLRRAKPDFVFGNPPCAPWSVAGKKGDHWKTDPRLETTRGHFGLVEVLRPKVWAWESVLGAF